MLWNHKLLRARRVEIVESLVHYLLATRLVDHLRFESGVSLRFVVSRLFTLGWLFGVGCGLVLVYHFRLAISIFNRETHAVKLLSLLEDAV